MNPETLRPQEFIARELSVADFLDLRAIRLNALQTDPQAFEGILEVESQLPDSHWLMELSRPERGYFAAEDGGKLIATVGLEKTMQDHWLIDAVYTRPEYRRKGIAKGLMNRVCEEAKLAGVDKMSLLVNPQQTAALEMYIKLGFQYVKVEPGQKMGDGQMHDEYYLEIKLS